MSRRFRALLAGALAIAVVALVAAGCGGGGDATGSGSESSTDSSDGGPAEVASVTISKSEYAKKGDKICETVPARFNSRREKLPKKQQENPVAFVPKAAIPPIWTAVDEFAELGAPKGEEAKAQAIVVALEKAARGLEKEPKGELAGPNSSFAEFNKLTKAYKMEFCAQI